MLKMRELRQNKSYSKVTTLIISGLKVTMSDIGCFGLFDLQKLLNLSHFEEISHKTVIRGVGCFGFPFLSNRGSWFLSVFVCFCVFFDFGQCILVFIVGFGSAFCCSANQPYQQCILLQVHLGSLYLHSMGYLGSWLVRCFGL